MPEHYPKIDGRTAAHIARQVKELLRIYAPEWKETDLVTKEPDRLGLALIACFARFAELIIERLNRAPEKNFLAFLDLLGAARLPPQPARVPLTFFLAAGSTTDVIVPAGTQIAAAPAEGGSEPVVFETERELVVASVGLVSVYVRHPTEDQYTRAVLNDSALLKTASARDFRVYKGEQYIEHILYLGHRSLLGSQALQDLTLDVKLETGLESADQRQVSWEIYNGREWTEIKRKADTTQGLTTSGVITLTLNAPSIETTVFFVDKSGNNKLVTRRSRWLRCRLTTVAPTGKSLPKITELKLSGKIELPLDAAFADASPLDLSKDFYPFGERPQFGNTLYLAQGEFFSRAAAIAELSIILNKPGDYLDENTLDPGALSPRAQPTLIWEYWNGRTWSNLTVTDNTDKFTNLERNTLVFTIPWDIKGSTVNGIESYWVRARIAAGGYGRESGYAPFVGDPNVTGTIEGSYEKGAGTLTGKIESKATGTSGTLSATITGSTLSGLITGTIIGTINGTIAGTKVIVTIAASAVGRVTGTITGSAEGTIVANEISGTIKATLLAYRYASTLVPPSIKTVTASYKDTEKVSPEVVLTYNDFTYDEVATTSPFYPFRKSLDEKPALYLGFVRPEGRKFPQWPFTLYFSIAEVDYGTEPDNRSPDAPPRLAWEYWNGSEWASTSVHDETEVLAHSGLITWLPPADIAPRADFGLPEQYWLRAGLQEGDYQHYPKLRRVLLNATLAAQTVTVTDEVLGSSDGSEGQRFRANHAPVLSDQQLEVEEAEMPTAAECAKIREEEGEDAIPAVEAATARKAVWVRWYEVPDFHGSGARDRHYVLDHLKGEVRFGDGQNGMIPPRGIGNIRLVRYQTGGGARGNQPAGAITHLKTTVPYVDKVTNLEPAAGGADAEGLDSLHDRAPRMIRHGGRAVTREDYEDLAMLATPEVARAKCVPLWNPSEVALLLDTERDMLQRPGSVTVIIVPRSGAAKPVPSLELIGRVRNYLGGYSLPALNRFVVGPRYVRVEVEAVIALVSLEAASHVEAAIMEVLSGFLHPLTGGFKGSGWPWGRKPHGSDFYRCIESIPGVDHVSRLTVSEHPEIERLTETDHFLVYSGTHRIRLTFGET